MRNHLIVSGTLHTALIALMVLGMPPRDRQLELPSSESFEVVDISEITAAARIDEGQPSPEPIKAPPAPPEAKPTPPPPAPPEPEAPPPPPPPPQPKVPEPPPPPEPPKPEPPKPVPTPPPPPAPKAPEPPPPPPPPPVPDPTDLPKPPEPKPEPPKPEAKPQPPKPEPPKPEPPKPEPPKPEPPKPEPPKPEEKKPEVKKPEVKKPPEKEVAKTDPLADLLKRTQQNKPTEDKKPSTAQSSPSKPSTSAQAAPSGATRATKGPEQPFRPSGRAIDAIRSQVGKNWNFDPGRRDSDTMQVAIRIEVDPDGTVKTAVIDDRYRSRYMSDRAYAAAVDAAVRAIRRSSPLDLMKEEFTPQTYESWRTILFTFDPRDMF